MSDPLYSSLLSLLPHEYVNESDSVSDHIDVAANYIKALEKNVKELEEKREKLEKSLLQETPINNDGSSSSSSIRSTNNSNNNNNNDDDFLVNEDFVKIKALSELLEIRISSVAKEEAVFPLSKVINILQEEGLVVVNCGYSKVDHSWVHIIHCEIDDHEKMVDCSRLKRILTNEISSFATT